MFFYEEVFREFQDRRVKYVVVGGIAVNLLGSLRSTADMDILVEMTDENIRKVVDALTDLGFRAKQPVDPAGLACRETRSRWMEEKHMKAFNFYKDGELEEVDVVLESPVEFQEAISDAVHLDIDGVDIPVISIDHLIEMKKVTGRPIDRQDIRELRKIQELREDQ